MITLYNVINRRRFPCLLAKGLGDSRWERTRLNPRLPGEKACRAGPCSGHPLLATLRLQAWPPAAPQDAPTGYRPFGGLYTPHPRHL